MAEAPLSLLRDYRPDAPLIFHRGSWISQGAFLGAVAALAGRLPAGSHALNLCGNRYHFMLGLCAAVLRGVTTLLPANRQSQTLAELVDEYPGSIALVDEPCDPGCPTVVLGSLQATGSVPLDAPGVAADQPAVVAFTSGSTGRPVANAKCWASLCATARQLAGRLALASRAPTIVATVPSQHMYGLEMTVMMTLQGGCRLHADHPFYPGDVARSLRECAAPRMLVTTPVHLRALVGAGSQLPAIETVVSATAPLDAALAAAVGERCGGEVLEIYGCTEAGSIATRSPVRAGQWQVLAGLALRQTPAGVEVDGPQLAAPVVLQDQLELLAPDRFRLRGRASDLINVGGKRASLAELSRKLLEIEGVEDAVVFVPDGGQRPAALVVSHLGEREIAQRLARRLDPVLVPRPIRRVPRIPRNDTGKTPRAGLLLALQRGDV